MMLITSFGASIGGMATPVGTPPNLIGIGLIERITGTHIDFFRWMAIGVPLVLVLFAFLRRLLRAESARAACRSARRASSIVRDELRNARPDVDGAAQRAHRVRRHRAAVDVARAVLAIAGLAGIAAREGATRRRCPRASRRCSARCCCSCCRCDWAARQFTLTWDEAARIDWGIVLLYGGGLAMGDLAFSTGLASCDGRRRSPRWLPSQSNWR